MNDTALIIGAGFSNVAGLPLTSEITEDFLTLGPTPATPDPIQTDITRHLHQFWQRVFGFQDGGVCPSFEDHFTSIDLAANTGHSLGGYYTPARLRGIRRMSIHRVFDILDSIYVENEDLKLFLNRFASGRCNSILSTNWDIVVEKLLVAAGKKYNYCLPGEPVGQGEESESKDGLRLLKLQGSSNWAYCDSCRRLFRSSLFLGKSTLFNWTFLEKRDFEALGSRPEILLQLDRRAPSGCSACNAGRLSARVATFSYSKAYNFVQFQVVWENALSELRNAKRWIFVGYSLPDADYELRQLLKTAQLSNHNEKLKIEVVMDNNSNAIERYKRFFGDSLQSIETHGFANWLSNGALQR